MICSKGVHQQQQQQQAHGLKGQSAAGGAVSPAIIASIREVWT